MLLAVTACLRLLLLLLLLGRQVLAAQAAAARGWGTAFMVPALWG
jgi:hypothetical protein